MMMFDFHSKLEAFKDKIRKHILTILGLILILSLIGMFFIIR